MDKVESAQKVEQPTSLGDSLMQFGFTLLFLSLFFGVPVLLFWFLAPDSIRFPARYGMVFHVPYSHVHVANRPKDCDWDHAPIGDKGCSYEWHVSTQSNARNRVTDVYIQWDKVQE